jgi:hypothetical protein
MKGDFGVDEKTLFSYIKNEKGKKKVFITRSKKLTRFIKR